MRAMQILSAEYVERSLQLTVMERLDEWHGVNTAQNKN